MIRTWLTKGTLLALLGALAACSATPGASTSTACPSGQRFFNGKCSQECLVSAGCDQGSTCVALDATGGVCQPGDAGAGGGGGGVSCAYLGSDSKCFGVEGYYTYDVWGYSSMNPLPSDPPYANGTGLTSNPDDGFNSAYGYAGSQGCQGDATYVRVASTTDPACTARHDVARCRRVGDTCRLLGGTTPERFAP